ncbi:MAG: DEAD/DEAH box helicase [Armatimonadota bacterium]
MSYKDRSCAPQNARRKPSFAVPCTACGHEVEQASRPSGTPIYCGKCEQPADQPAQERGTFGDFSLDSRLERAIQEAGFETPTPVQAATIPVGLSGRDLIGTAQTGTGKTAAFALPILQHLLINPSKKRCTRALVLAPTRELAEQVSDSFKQLGKFTKIRAATVYGGVGMGPQEQALKSGVEVIVACPGRLLDHIDRGNTDFSGVEKLVLDEADRMLDMGFLPSIKRVLSHLPRERQTMLFSATFAPELTKLVEGTLKDPQRMELGLSAPAKTVAHALYPCPQHLKTSLVLNLLEKFDTNSVLIFTRTKHRANRVAQQIGRAGHKTLALHANKSQNQRQSALDDFRAGRCQILVATDIAARGLDVESISHVINYDIPDTADTYIHRIGRTGRAEREGDAVTLITKEDGAVVWDIEKALGTRIERVKLEDFDYAAAPPPKDEFKRAPMPRRAPRPRAARATGG